MFRWQMEKYKRGVETNSTSAGLQKALERSVSRGGYMILAFYGLAKRGGEPSTSVLSLWTTAERGEKVNYSKSKRALQR